MIYRELFFRIDYVLGMESPYTVSDMNIRRTYAYLGESRAIIRRRKACHSIKLSAKFFFLVVVPRQGSRKDVILCVRFEDYCKRAFSRIPQSEINVGAQ